MTLVTPTPTAIDIFPDSIQSALREIERAMNMNVMVRMRDKESSNMGVMMHLVCQSISGIRIHQPRQWCVSCRVYSWD